MGAPAATDRDLSVHDQQAVKAMRDQYQVLGLKTLSIFRHGYERTSAAFVAKHDDEYCMSVPEALRVVDAFRRRAAAAGGADAPAGSGGEGGADRGPHLYAGYHRWEGDEHAGMRGPTGLVAPYFSGGCYVLSRGLAGVVAVEDFAYSLFAGVYGTSSEDANMGKWILHARQTRGARVVYVADGDLGMEVRGGDGWGPTGRPGLFRVWDGDAEVPAGGEGRGNETAVDAAPPCEDEDPNCLLWAGEGQCTANPGHMLRSCCRSCASVGRTAVPVLAEGAAAK